MHQNQCSFILQNFSSRSFMLIGNMSELYKNHITTKLLHQKRQNSSNKPSQLSDPLQTGADPVNRCAGRQSVEQTYVSREKWKTAFDQQSWTWKIQLVIGVSLAAVVLGLFAVVFKSPNERQLMRWKMERKEWKRWRGIRQEYTLPA